MMRTSSAWLSFADHTASYTDHLRSDDMRVSLMSFVRGCARGVSSMVHTALSPANDMSGLKPMAHPALDRSATSPNTHLWLFRFHTTEHHLNPINHFNLS